MAIRIINDKCRGCSICLKNCPFGAITVENRKAVIGSGCTGCNACIETCPFNAIVRAEDGNENIDLSSYKGVWVFAEQRDGKIMPVVYELLGEGKKLAEEIGTELCAVLCGSNVREQANELIAYGADKVYLADDKELETYRTDAYTKVIYDAIKTYKPEIFLFGATHIGRDLGPCLAVKAGTGLTADCTKLEIDPEDKKLKQTRPAFGGNRPQMSTVRPGVMEKAHYDKDHKGEIIQLNVSFEKDEIRTKVLEIVKGVGRTASLADAEIIVAGGRGLGKPEGFDLLRRFAEKIGGTIGSSRACVDSGWIDHSYQVGLTGTTVKPRIYFACGISGAIQHVAGMQGSKTIIAINKNENAPIFKIADYGIVGDLYKIIPAIMDALD